MIPYETPPLACISSSQIFIANGVAYFLENQLVHSLFLSKMRLEPRIEIMRNDIVVLLRICLFHASDWSSNTVVFAGKIRGME